MVFVGNGFTMGGGVLGWSQGSCGDGSCRSAIFPHPCTFIDTSVYQDVKYSEKKINKAQKKEKHNLLANRTETGRNKVIDVPRKAQPTVQKNHIIIDKSNNILNNVDYLFDNYAEAYYAEAYCVESESDLVRILRY